MRRPCRSGSRRACWATGRHAREGRVAAVNEVDLRARVPRGAGGDERRQRNRHGDPGRADHTRWRGRLKGRRRRARRRPERRRDRPRREALRREQRAARSGTRTWAGSTSPTSRRRRLERRPDRADRHRLGRGGRALRGVRRRPAARPQRPRLRCERRLLVHRHGVRLERTSDRTGSTTRNRTARASPRRSSRWMRRTASACRPTARGCTWPRRSTTRPGGGR